MTLSPMEGVQLLTSEPSGPLGTNQLNEIGGLVFGPLFGWLGYRWHARRSWLAAALVTGALCLEPIAVTVAGRNVGRSGFVWAFEIVVGVVVAHGSCEYSEARRVGTACSHGTIGEPIDADDNT